jgi:DNA-binding beta-propeller fold protein YncE
LDTTNRVSVFETEHDRMLESFDVVAPESLYTNTRKLGGGNTDALALTPDERTLLVSNGGQNAVAVVRLSDVASGLAARRVADPEGDGDAQPVDLHRSEVIGLAPTGRYPTGVSVSKDGRTWYISNYKGATKTNLNRCAKPGQTSCVPQDWRARQPGQMGAFEPNRATVSAQNQATWRIEKAGMLSMPAPSPLELARLTKQVARNNHFDQPETAAADEKLFAFLRQHIKHVIYIIKENKTYDEVLGDLEAGNGDPSLTYFPNAFTPNHHAIARNFVTLDNFLVSGAGSWTGWDWSVSAQTNDYRERSEALASATSAVKNEGFMEGEPGINRNLNMAYATNEERHQQDPISPNDPDLLPGARDVAAPDGPGGEEGKGYIWAAALAKGLTVRNWGFFGGFFRTIDIPFIHDPYGEKRRVFFPVRPALMEISDPYYYSFDPAMPDYWRVQEWKREFAGFVAAHSAPNLMLVQLTNDHTGDYAHAIDGVNTVDTQVADNDYALGLILETVANSPFAKDTLIISVEDDPLGGLDHVDAFRSVALVAGPYVRRHAVVSKRYTTVSLVKTIEEILGIDPIGLNDALAAPMSDIFDSSVTNWSYKPIVPDVLRSTKLPLPAGDEARVALPRRSSAYWTKAMAGQDFSGADRIDSATFNRALWRGLKGDAPYPSAGTGIEMRENRGRPRAQTR